jgi:hypothetical protein
MHVHFTPVAGLSPGHEGEAAGVFSEDEGEAAGVCSEDEGEAHGVSTEVEGKAPGVCSEDDGEVAGGRVEDVGVPTAHITAGHAHAGLQQADHCHTVSHHAAGLCLQIICLPPDPVFSIWIDNTMLMYKSLRM